MWKGDRKKGRFAHRAKEGYGQGAKNCEEQQIFHRVRSSVIRNADNFKRTSGIHSRAVADAINSRHSELLLVASGFHRDHNVSSEETVRVRHSPWAITLGTVSGIPVRVHATFALFLLYIASGETSTHDALTEVAFVLSLFTCVLLHELGHALTARRFGVGTRDIVLYPFGGIAALSGRVTPWAELWIALAGPMVNLVIAAALLPFLDLNRPFLDLNGITALAQPMSILVRLLAANLFLALFNLIPAIPMDGGRVFRATLALLRVRRATAIAARLSQFLSILLGLLGLYIGNPILMIIAAVVFMNSLQELMHERAQLGAVGHTIADVMIERSQLQVLLHGMTLSEALAIALKSLQPAFPVLFGEQIMGVVSREDLLQEAALNTEEQYLSGLLQREYAVTSPQERIEDFLARSEQESGGPVLVVEGGELRGMVHREKLFEFLYLQGLRRSRAASHNSQEDAPVGF
ncbi:MAG: site-2 protease family protein [Proteobacteria bacterium]|nr:site-2 protease family protein [Pseudomonadota bacterium]